MQRYSISIQNADNRPMTGSNDQNMFLFIAFLLHWYIYSWTTILPEGKISGIIIVE